VYSLHSVFLAMCTTYPALLSLPRLIVVGTESWWLYLYGLSEVALPVGFVRMRSRASLGDTACSVECWWLVTINFHSQCSVSKVRAAEHHKFYRTVAAPSTSICLCTCSIQLLQVCHSVTAIPCFVQTAGSSLELDRVISLAQCQ
jgi:hypothetical protein